MEKINFAQSKKYGEKEAIEQRKEINFRLDREWDERERAAIGIIEKIQEAGFEAYFAGGAVRDYINGNKPNDVDICTSANSNEVKKIFEKESGSSIYYKSEKAQENKIINIKIGGFDFEVASFRKDVFLSEDISDRIKALEKNGYSKRLIEYDNEYEDYLTKLNSEKKCELLSEKAMKNILKEDVSILPTDKEGVYRIEDDGRKYDIFFYKTTTDRKDADEDGGEIEKKQKQVAGRHPDLTITKGVKLEEDARRRDFTMNGLFFDPKQGKIIDCVGGYDDAINKNIRFIGDPMKRIREDKIRILRFFRFKGAMGLSAAEESLQAIKNWFSSEDRKKEFMDMFYLNQRIKPEFEKILKNPNRAEILDDMMNEGVLELVMPEISRMKGVEQPKDHHKEGDVWEHTKNCLKELISFDDYKNKYPAYDLEKIRQDYLAFPGSGGENILLFEDYADECKSRNIKADENRYSIILKKWQGKMPSEKEYIGEFEKKDSKDIEREYLELAWSVLLHDSGKVHSWEKAKKEGHDDVNFHLHEKVSADISKYFMYIEKEAKWYRGEGLNTKGERLKGLNYEAEFAGNVVWLVSNHMHHLDFSRMSRTKQERLMEDQNFEKLLELWRADIFGSKPVLTGNYEDALRIYEEYKKYRKEKSIEAKKEYAIKPDDLMSILKSEGVEMTGGLAKVGNYTFSRTIPVLTGYIDNLFRENKLLHNEAAERKIRNLVGREKLFDKIHNLIETDNDIKKFKIDAENVSGKKKNTQVKKIKTAMNRRADEIFESYFEKSA